MLTRTSFSLSVSILFFSYLTTAKFNWGDYPICAQTSLENTAPGSCDYGSATLTEVEETDDCLCYDTTFLKAAAQSIWSSCGCTDLMTSAGVAYSNCLTFAGGMAMSADEFIAAGDGGQVSCSNSSSPASTTTSTPSQTTVNQVGASTSQQLTTMATSLTALTPSPTSQQLTTMATSLTALTPSTSQQLTTMTTSLTALTPSPTSPNNPSSGSNDSSGSGGLSPGVIAAISVVTAVFTVLGGAATIWMCCRQG